PVTVAGGEGTPLHQFVAENAQPPQGSTAFWSIFGTIGGVLVLLLVLTPFPLVACIRDGGLLLAASALRPRMKQVRPGGGNPFAGGGNPFGVGGNPVGGGGGNPAGGGGAPAVVTPLVLADRKADVQGRLEPNDALDKSTRKPHRVYDVTLKS